MKHIFRPAFLTVALLSLPFLATAQIGGPDPSSAFDANFNRLFGDIKAYQAKATISVKENKGETTIEAKMAMADEKNLMEMDLTQIKGPSVPAEMSAQLKAMGMDILTAIVDSKAKRMMLIYPSAKAYADMPLPKEQAETLDKQPKMQRTELGKEQVDGHDCTKYRYQFEDDKGKKRESIVWHATKLKDFPIKVQTTEKSGEVTILFKDVRFDRPAADLFAAPADYTKYAGIMELMQGVMMKQMQQPGR